MNFRSLPKKRLDVQLPVDLLVSIGYLSVEQGRPENEIVARLLCKALGVEPETYGLKSNGKVRANRRRIETIDA